MSQWGPDLAVEEQLKAIRARLDKLEAPVRAKADRRRRQTVCPHCGGHWTGMVLTSNPVQSRCAFCTKTWYPSRYPEKDKP